MAVTLTEHSQNFGAKVQLLKDAGRIVLPGSETVITLNTPMTETNSLDAAIEITRVACQFEDERNSLLSLRGFADQIKALQIPHGEEVTIHIDGSSKTFFHPNINNTQDLLFSILTHQNLLEFADVESSRHQVQYGVYPFTDKAIVNQKPFIAESANQLLAKIKRYIAEHQEQLASDLNTESFNAINAKYCTVGDKLSQLLRFNIEQAVSTLDNDLDFLAPLKLAQVRHQIQAQRQNIEHIMALVELHRELEALARDKTILTAQMLRNCLSTLTANAQIEASELEILQTNFEATHTINASMQCAIAYGTYLFQAVASTVSSTAGYGDYYQADDTVLALRDLTTRAISQKAESLSRVSSNIEFNAQDFTTEDPSALKSAVNKFMLLEALTNVDDSLAEYKKVNDDFITKSARWSIFGVITKLMAKTFVLRRLLNDKILLLQEADGLAATIKRIQSEVRDDTSIESLQTKHDELRRALISSKDNAKEITENSRYLLFKDTNREASRVLQTTLDESKEVVSACFAASAA